MALGGIWVAAFLALSRLPFSMKGSSESYLVVTFRNSAKADTACREPTPEEKSKMLTHMRLDRICERSRASTTLRVTLDGRTILEKPYKPLGLQSDGISMALEEFPVSAGEHEVGIQVRDAAKGSDWDYQFSRRVAFRRDHRYVIEFDRDRGFKLAKAEGG